MSENPNRTKRLVFVISGATDAVLGATIILTSLGFFPIDLNNMGMPTWIVWLVGGVLFISGTWMAVYNYSRIDDL